MKKIAKTDTRINRTAYGPIGLVVVIPLTLVGAYFTAAGLGFLPLSGPANAPFWVIAAAGLAFLLAGLILVVQVLRGINHRFRASQVLKQFPDRPWLADYPWETDGILDEAAGRSTNMIMNVLFLTIFLAPFNWWAFIHHDSPLLVKLVTGLFDAILLMMFWTMCYNLLQFNKYGHSRLLFASFPFAPGERLRVAFRPNRFSRLRATLRYIEERFREERTGGNRSVHFEAFEYYSETREIEDTGNAEYLLLEFDLPDKPEWTTRMTAAPNIRYWELVLEAAEPGIDFRTTFPLPVYQAGAASRQANEGFDRLVA